MYLPIRERVHVTGVSMGFLEICRYLYCHMAVYDLDTGHFISLCICICSILESGSITEQKLSRGVCADDLVARNRVLETIHSV